MKIGMARADVENIR